MKAKRNITELSGVVAVDKPAGLTSHDVVKQIRRISGERRVGHCGTLDPFATGVLIVCIGPATRLANYLMDARKTYVGRITFGVATDTDDVDGALTTTMPVASELCQEEFAQRYLTGLIGMHSQLPPNFSAVKHKGVRAYDAARRGDTLQLEPRNVEVYATELSGISVINSSTTTQVSWDVAFEVSKGTYIRALARDIASELGTCGHLSALRRTRSGRVGLVDCHTLADIEKLGVKACYLDPISILDLPLLVLDDEQRVYVGNGRPLVTQVEELPLVACVYRSSLLALYGFDDQQGALLPITVIPRGVKGPG